MPKVKESWNFESSFSNSRIWNITISVLDQSCLKLNSMYHFYSSQENYSCTMHQTISSIYSYISIISQKLTAKLNDIWVAKSCGIEIIIIILSQISEIGKFRARVISRTISLIYPSSSFDIHIFIYIERLAPLSSAILFLLDFEFRVFSNGFYYWLQLTRLTFVSVVVVFCHCWL